MENFLGSFMSSQPGVGEFISLIIAMILSAKRRERIQVVGVLSLLSPIAHTSSTFDTPDLPALVFWVVVPLLPFPLVLALCILLLPELKLPCPVLRPFP